ncbi:hypothetical protein Syun_024691 [Stephania yunnanensis]|uniref:Activator of Hsp90 ATPase AHSA1-like N-terminal domain-containing protein n=1 Tax=Stephania yunnanensis TaxID=152371 RepID=A0AAP0EQQ3_9MAGN
MESSSGEAEAEAEAEVKGSSYTYWVREGVVDAAPLPLPRKLSNDEVAAIHQNTNNALGSVWNGAGTWEEKNLSSWANARIKELLACLPSLEFTTGKAQICQVSKCAGDAFVVTVRNKKRFGYTYQLTLKFKGEWQVQGEAKEINGHMQIPEFSFGELDDLQVDVQMSEDKDVGEEDKMRIAQDLKIFLQPIRGKLLQFEDEIKYR